MIVQAIVNEWVDRCREMARLARRDVQRSAAFDEVNPDATVRLVRRDPPAKSAKN